MDGFELLLLLGVLWGNIHIGSGQRIHWEEFHHEVTKDGFCGSNAYGVDRNNFLQCTFT